MSSKNQQWSVKQSSSPEATPLFSEPRQSVEGGAVFGSVLEANIRSDRLAAKEKAERGEKPDSNKQAGDACANSFQDEMTGAILNGNESREGPMSEETKGQTPPAVLPLRAGGEAEVGMTLAKFEHLKAIRRVSPQKFLTLLNVAHGRSEAGSSEHLAELEDQGYLSNGVVSEDIRKLIFSGFTPEGKPLDSPFKLERAVDRFDEAMAREVGEAAIRDLFRRRDKNAPPSK